MKKAASLLLFSTTVISNANVAEAKDKKEPLTRSGVESSWKAVRDELELPDGGVSTLQALVEKADFEGIMEFTKNYDLEFRKAKMGKARKSLPKEEKDTAVLRCNAVTFDLIGMNKGSRPGQQNIDQVNKYFSEMKADINSFLEMEKLVDLSQFES